MFLTSKKNYLLCILLRCPLIKTRTQAGAVVAGSHCPSHPTYFNFAAREPSPWATEIVSHFLLVFFVQDP